MLRCKSPFPHCLTEAKRLGAWVPSVVNQQVVATTPYPITNERTRWKRCLDLRAAYYSRTGSRIFRRTSCRPVEVEDDKPAGLLMFSTADFVSAYVDISNMSSSMVNKVYTDISVRYPPLTIFFVHRVTGSSLLCPTVAQKRRRSETPDHGIMDI